MSAGEWNPTIEQGATWNPTLTYTDANGDPVDITGYTIRMQARATYTSDATLDLSTTEGSITITDAAAGEFEILLSAATTATLTRDYFYDIELVDGSGIVTRLLQGRITLSKEVTR